MSAAIAAAAAAGCTLLLFAPAPPTLDLSTLRLPVAALTGLLVAWFALSAGLRLPLVVIGGVAVWAGQRQVSMGRARRDADRRAGVVIDTCEGLVADLRAGQPPLAALMAASREWPEFGAVAAAGRIGADVPGVLRELAQLPGAHGLGAVAAAWTLAHRSGAGLADAVALVARGLREHRAAARVVETEMASARATARLLAVLPVGVLLIGRGAGGDPFGFLLDTTAGLVCLGGGLSLSWMGLTWLERIARSVQA